MLITSVKTDPIMMFAEDVRAGLTKPGQKELPSKYFYDEIGSALFDVITILPEYGLTRADERLLRKYADAIAARTSSPAMVVELGSGNGKKAQWILKSLARRQPTTYCPIELSHSALLACEHEMAKILFSADGAVLRLERKNACKEKDEQQSNRNRGNQRCAVQAVVIAYGLVEIYE